MDVICGEAMSVNRGKADTLFCPFTTLKKVMKFRENSYGMLSRFSVLIN